MNTRLETWRNHTPTAMRQHWHGHIEPLLSDDRTWLPFRNFLILLVSITWMTAGAIFLMVEFG